MTDTQEANHLVKSEVDGYNVNIYGNKSESQKLGSYKGWFQSLIMLIELVSKKGLPQKDYTCNQNEKIIHNYYVY